MNREYLQGLNKVSEKEKTIKRYLSMIESSAMRGGQKFKISDVSQKNISELIEKLSEKLPGVSITLEEYQSPIMETPEKFIMIDWS
jgi:hypothetical protein